MLGKAFAGDNAGAQMIEIVGFKYFAAIVGILFIVFIGLTCINVKEKSTAEMKTTSVGQMFKALLSNDQAMVIVGAIVYIVIRFLNKDDDFDDEDPDDGCSE